MQNKVELNIPSGALFPFKVASGTVKIGEVVEIAGNRAVKTATADSKAVIGVVYSGTVGVDGVNVGYSSANDDVVTVVVMKPMVYLQASGTVTAGSLLKSTGAGKVADIGAGTFDMALGRAISGGTNGSKVIVALG